MYKFLQIRDRKGNIIPDASWDDELPDGWRKAFGKQMWDELHDILVKYNYEDQFQFVQIKEKWGSLVMYNNGIPTEMYKEYYDWDTKYEHMSMAYCINCGKPTKYLTPGWITYICEDCAKGHEQNYDELTWSDIPHYSSSDDSVEHESKYAYILKEVWKEK